MIRSFSLVMALLLASVPALAADSVIGQYRLAGEHDAAGDIGVVDFSGVMIDVLPDGLLVHRDKGEMKFVREPPTAPH